MNGWRSEMIILIYLLCLVSVILMLMIYKTLQKHKEAKYYADQWQKWEHEYWLLRTSEAIKDEFNIHLSWLARGEVARRNK
jgi:urea transporter